MSLAAKARAHGLVPDTTYKRLALGWSLRKALARPSREGKPKRCGWCFVKGHNVRTCQVHPISHHNNKERTGP